MIAGGLSIFTLISCEFMEATLDDAFYFSSYLQRDNSWGLFRSYAECVDTEDLPQDFGATWQVAQAFGIIACIFGGVVFILLMVGLFTPLPPRVWKSIKITLFALAPIEMVTFSFYGACPDNYSCTFGQGSLVAIGASIFWLIAGICACKMPTSDKAPCGTALRK